MPPKVASNASAPPKKGPAEAQPAVTTLPRPPDIDASNEAAFTASVLGVLRNIDADGGWSIAAPRTLMNRTGLMVSLDRIWRVCEEDPADCARNAENFVSGVQDVAVRGLRKANRSMLVPLLRDREYLASFPADVRAQTLVEPIVGDLVVFYAVDLGQSVRGAKAQDLTDSGVSRESLPGVALQNLEALSPFDAEGVCKSGAVAVRARGDYLESSHLLATVAWTKLAVHEQSIVAAAPAADTLVVACDASRAQLSEMARTVEKLWQAAQRPVSRTLLEWSPRGWTPLNP